MTQDFLSERGYAGLTSRIKRLSDQLLVSGRNFYKAIGADVEPNWFLVFRILQEDEVTTLSEITQKLGFSHPSVISIVKKMKAAGYLAITPHAQDSRKQEIRLTPKAKKDMPRNEKIWSACEQAVASLFDDEVFLDQFQQLEQALFEQPFKDRAINQLALQELQFVPFESKHAKAFDELNREWLDTHFYVEPYDDQLLKNPAKYFIDTGGEIIMAQTGEYSLGTAGMLKHSNDTIELAKMAVSSPAHRGLGIGHKTP